LPGQRRYNGFKGLMLGLILILAEHRDGKLKRVSLEALSEARRLYPAEEICVVLIGDQVASLADGLLECGANRIYLVEDPSLRHYASERYAVIVAEIAIKRKPALILMGATAMGKDLGPKVAAKIHAPFAQDCIALEITESGGLLATRPIYGGKLMMKVRAAQGESCLVATLRANIFPVSPLQTPIDRVIERFTPSLPDEIKACAQVKEVVVAQSSKVELSEAQIIVSGGRGLKEPTNFTLIEDLAEVLGAAVGASRAAVDAGWKPHSYQVGLTGKTVSPLLYIACGISGAIQHQAGMSSAKVIVAINKDANAPLFKIASYGIVGDLFEILPRLTAAIQKIRSV